MSGAGSYQKRRLRVSVTLGRYVNQNGTVTPAFVESGKDTVIFDGLRASAVINRPGGDFMTALHLRVFGMPESLMNQISTLGALPMAGRNNTVIVEAGDDAAGMSVAFTGTIINAWANMNDEPQVSFEIIAHTGGYDAVNTAPVTSYNGSVAAATVIEGIAKAMVRAFLNQGVNATLVNPYYPGTLIDQLHACAREAGIFFEDDGKLITIWPRDGYAAKDDALIVSKATGLIGYPAFTANGIIARCLYRPEMRLGSKVSVVSSLTPASGQFRIFSISHVLEAEIPDGQWFTTFAASRPEYAPVATR
ncbi:hypothetical protein HMPREF9946_01541 [Acetobacteraceae bacterium AT-5844]|nr:hypothetical protein HMPREF9946_01541 [Acetobacteraceae bacterium AT-5844]